MFQVGQLVRVLEPFADSFPGAHEITAITVHEDGQIACELNGDGAFDPKYLEAVE